MSYDNKCGELAGFSTYADAEKFALAKLRELMRKQRDEWANKARLAAALKAKAAA